ncbi:MAG: histidine phosphatase family protein [Pseudomonadota bacterium]
MAVILMRHTRPVLGPAYCYGSLDIAVADTFTADATAALERLPAVDRIVSSPLRRARRLAETVAEARGLSLAVDPRVSEMDFGAWEGLLWSAVPRGELDAWAADFLDARPHGGESVRTFRLRIREALEDHAADEGDCLVVCHAGVVRAAFAGGSEAQDFNQSIGYGDTLRWPSDRFQTGGSNE